MRQDKCKPTTFHLQPPPANITFNHYLGGTGHSKYTAQEGLIEDHTSRISDISVRAIVTSQSTFGNGFLATVILTSTDNIPSTFAPHIMYKS